MGKYVAPIGQAAGASYWDRSGGTAGAGVPAAAIEWPQRELDALITALGLTPDDANRHQLADALAAGKFLNIPGLTNHVGGVAGTMRLAGWDGTGHVDFDVDQLFTGRAGIDLVARDMAMVTAFQQFISGNIAAGTFADWARVNTFSTDSLPTRTGATWSGGAYSNQQTYSADLTVGGTPISSGDQPSTAPVYAFDDNGASHWESAQTGGSVSGGAWVGYNFGAGNTKHIRRVSLRYRSSVGWGPTSVKVQRSADGSSWTDVATISPVDNGSNAVQTFDIPASGASQYWRFLANSNVSSGGGFWVEEAEMMALIAPQNMTLVDTAFAVPSAPLDGRAVILQKFISGGVLNTDIKAFMARDGSGAGGWVQGTLSLQDAFVFNTGFNLLVADFDLSTLPTGTQPLVKVETYNTVEQQIRALGAIAS